MSGKSVWKKFSKKSTEKLESNGKKKFVFNLIFIISRVVITYIIVAFSYVAQPVLGWSLILVVYFKMVIDLIKSLRQNCY